MPMNTKLSPPMSLGDDSVAITVLKPKLFHKVCFN